MTIRNVHFVAAILLTLGSQTLFAGKILQPASVIVQPPLTENKPAEHLIDQSGLSITYSSLTDDFDEYLEAEPTHVDRFTGKWQTDVDFRIPGDVDFNLGGTFDVSAMAVWNTDDRNGVDEFTLSIANNAEFLNAVIFGEFVAEQLLTPQVFAFPTTEGAYLRMTITAADGDRIRIGEVALEVESALLLGDINGDGSVSFADFLILSDNFSQSVDVGTGGDLDEDGVVGFPDFLILSSNFGATAAVPVPEPGGLLLLLLGAGMSRSIHTTRSQNRTGR